MKPKKNSIQNIKVGDNAAFCRTWIDKDVVTFAELSGDFNSLHLSSVEDLKEQCNVNIFGSFNLLSACALRLKEHKEGVIVGITTAAVVSQTNTRARGAYSLVKFALQGMLAAFKEELASYNVRVYSVAPGVMNGGMNHATPQAFIEMIKEKSPTKTLAQSTDVAAAISFLCSNDSIHLTNLTLLIAPESGTM